MSLPGRTRAAALCAAVSAALIAGMAGTAIAYGDPDCADRCLPAPVAALSSASSTTSAPSPEPTPAVPVANRCDPAAPDPCSTPHTRAAVGTGSGPTP